MTTLKELMIKGGFIEMTNTDDIRHPYYGKIHTTAQVGLHLSSILQHGKSQL